MLALHTSLARHTLRRSPNWAGAILVSERLSGHALAGCRNNLVYSSGRSAYSFATSNRKRIKSSDPSPPCSSEGRSSCSRVYAESRVAYLRLGAVLPICSPFSRLSGIVRSSARARLMRCIQTGAPRWSARPSHLLTCEFGSFCGVVAAKTKFSVLQWLRLAVVVLAVNVRLGLVLQLVLKSQQFERNV